MPITVTRDDARRRMTATASGELSPAELLEFFHTHRTGDLAKYQLLFDATAATARARPTDVQTLVNEVASDAARTGTVRGAVAIVASDALLDLAHMYETLCEGAGLHVIRVFRDEAGARQWLGW
jgi:hypothetical protein